MRSRLRLDECVLFLLRSSDVSLTVIVLQQSFRRQHFLSALLWTLALGVLFPSLLPAISFIPILLLAMIGHTGYLSENPASVIRLAFASFLPVCIAADYGFVLHRNLVQRKFALERAGG